MIRLSTFSNVLLPAPLRPMMPTTSPFLMSKLTSLSPESLGFRPAQRVLQSAEDRLGQGDMFFLVVCNRVRLG